MFANRYTAFIDACSLAGALKRNLILSLAEADFFSVRWSEAVMAETRKAIRDILSKRGIADPDTRSDTAIAAMLTAFDDAMADDYADLLGVAVKLPDQADAHVLAAAIKTRAHMIVTDNIRDFPVDILRPLNIEARTTDEFVANVVTLHEGKAVSAIRTMRQRFSRPEKNAAQLFLDMEAAGLTATVDVLRPYEDSL